jgi:hypothetical protein
MHNVIYLRRYKTQLLKVRTYKIIIRPNVTYDAESGKIVIIRHNDVGKVKYLENIWTKIRKSQLENKNESRNL